MIVLDEAPESPSKVRATRPASTQLSRQLQLDQQAARRTVEDLAQRGVPSDGALAALHASLHKSASNDPAMARCVSITALDKKTKAFARRNDIATVILVVLATGALTGIIWTAIQIADTSQSAAKTTNDTQSAAAQSALQEILVEPALLSASTEAIPTQAAAKPAKERQPASSATYAIVEELTETRRLADEYLEEIDWLHTQNYSLRQTIDDLDSETTALNYELLQLELKLTALEADAKRQVAKHTVYNFVNVPIGGASELTESAPVATKN